MRIARTLLATALAVVALAGHAQQRGERGEHGRGGDMGRGSFGAPAYNRGPQGFGRGEPPGYGGPRFGPPRANIPQRYGPPPSYGGYGSPYGGPPMSGRWRDQEDFLRQGVRQGQLAPLGRVIGSIRQLTPGRQLDAGLEYMGPRLVYRVRWMTAQGRRIDYFVDAATGAVISGR